MEYPLWPLHSMWVLSYASNHNLIIDKVITQRVNFISFVPFRYFRKRLSLPQSYYPGHLTHVVRKDIGNWMSLMDLLEIKMSCDMMWWNSCACSYGNLFYSLYSTTWNNHSSNGEASDAPIYSRKYLSTFSRYFIIYTLILPS